MLALTKWFGLTTTEAERRLDDEPACIDEIAKKVLLMQANAAAKQHRPLCRGTHAKGVSARAEFEIFDVTVGRDAELSARLAKGIFATPGSYPATVRFANSDPCVNADTKADVRSLSFCVDLTRGGTAAPVDSVSRQDFSLQNATTLPLNDARAFLATMKVLTSPNPVKRMLSLAAGDLRCVLRTLALAQIQARQPLKPYQALRYWSTVPFRHGSKDVVKQSATPSPENQTKTLQKDSPDALKGELIRHLDQDGTMSRFDFGLQMLDVDRMTYRGKRKDADFWIENASVEWNELQAPFHTVARLTLLPKSQLSSRDEAALYFDVTANASPDSRPVGSINRARWHSEIASRQARQGGVSQITTE